MLQKMCGKSLILVPIHKSLNSIRIHIKWHPNSAAYLNATNIWHNVSRNNTATYLFYLLVQEFCGNISVQH